MENSELKSKILKNVKENIAISNIREEINMNKVKNRKILYGVLSSCAIFIICAVVVINSNIKIGEREKENSTIGINDKYGAVEELKKENLEIELNIYQIASLISSDMDVKFDYYNQKLPQWIWEEILNEFEEEMGISKSYFEEKIPDKFISTNFYTAKIPGYKNSNLSDDYKTHDYVFEYRTENNGKVIIAICKEEKPLRDYVFEFNGKKSKIGDIELEISQYNNQFLVEFNYNNINYDIETTDITEDELLELLQSILIEKHNNTPVEDKDVNVNEQPVENIDTGYPEYYAGKYIDDNGDNVVLLCEDTGANRKEISSLLGITENKTIFKQAKYSYNYLTELQSKISRAMQNKELSFVTTSALMEDSNNIRVTVISRDESDLNKIKELDTIGGAINIQYSENSIGKEDLLIEKAN